MVHVVGVGAELRLGADAMIQTHATIQTHASIETHATIQTLVRMRQRAQLPHTVSGCRVSVCSTCTAVAMVFQDKNQGSG
jgi:UDP-3-O-[3-hydroxymyristoyl] glucosamine N-acyltransferase